MTGDEWQQALADAARAPSPHNCQPARWRLLDGLVELHEDSARWLRVGDAEGRDNGIALGMAWEAMAIALTRYGWRLGQPALDSADYPPSAHALRRRAWARLERVEGDGVDPLIDAQQARSCHRGLFSPASVQQRARLDRCLAGHAGVLTDVPAVAIPSLARWYDEAAADGVRDAALAAELYAWLRFDRRDPRWSRDGLAADCMALGPLEARLGRIAMHPRALALLTRLGLAGMLVSERAKVLSATALVCVHAPAGRKPFDTGRAWHRAWLALTAAGFSCVPMSALFDMPRHRADAAALVPLPAGHVAVNMMRVGPSPMASSRSARLPLVELEIDAGTQTR